jgi:hypothetical protein
VHLEHLDALLEQLGHVRGCVRLWVERSRAQHAWGAVGERQCPVVHEAGDAGPVRVRQGREGADAHRAQVVDALLVAPAVRDGPRPSEQGSGGVEVGPHLLHQLRRHEVRVHVDDAGEAEIAEQLGQVGVAQRHGARAH